MTRAEFIEGRYVRAADLNGENAAVDVASKRHLELAHSADGSKTRLGGDSVRSPSGGSSVGFAVDNVGASVVIATTDVPEAVRLRSPGGHRVHGTIRSTDAAVQSVGALRLATTSTPASGPAPWSIQAYDELDKEGKVVSHELRIELDVPEGSSPENNRVVVGNVGGDGDFEAVLTVDASGNVTVHGNVQVAGTVSEGPITADPTDPRFAQAIANLVADRIVASATPPSGLPCTIDVRTSTSEAAGLHVTMTPVQVLTHWGAALEIQRSGTSTSRLLEIGSNAAANVATEVSTTVGWDPPLGDTEVAMVVVAFVAFDSHAQIVTGRSDVDVAIDHSN